MKVANTLGRFIGGGIVGAMAVSVFLFGSADIASAATKYLTKSELQAFLTGHRFKINGTTYEYRADGTIKVGKDTGKWWLDGNKYCTEWDGKKGKCMLVSFNGKAVYMLVHDHGSKANNHKWRMRNAD